MPAKFKSLLVVALVFFLQMPVQASAQVVVAFYSHELGSSFPHAFFTIKGKPVSGGPEVDTNFGFTAKSVTPAILMGSVVGVVESAEPGYVRNSDRKFALTVSDAQYSALMAFIEKWRSFPGKSYNLNRRNCIHFVGEAAQVLGLKVTFDKKLLKRPRSFLENVMRLNPGIAP